MLARVNLKRPLLKTKGLSTYHVDLFCQILLGKTNVKINAENGYTQKSHIVIDHTRKVMYKLLALEGLSRSVYMERVIYPRRYSFWWKSLFDKHRVMLMQIAIKPIFYNE